MLPENVVVFFDGDPAYTIPAGDIQTFKERYPQHNWTFSQPLAHLPQE